MINNFITTPYDGTLFPHYEWVIVMGCVWSTLHRLIVIKMEE